MAGINDFQALAQLVNSLSDKTPILEQSISSKDKNLINKTKEEITKLQSQIQLAISKLKVGIK